MAATAWSEPFDTINPAIWKNTYGVMPIAVGGGKIKFQRVSGNTCHMARVPFGAEGTLAARSVAVAFTVYPEESTAAWNLSSGNRQGTRPYFEPHENTYGFGFIDGTVRKYAGDRSGYHMYGDIQAPGTPYQIRTSAYLDPGSSRIYNTMSIDGVVVMDDFVQSASMMWDAVLGYYLPYFYFQGNDDVRSVVIGNLYGIHGGTREENRAFVKNASASAATIAPSFALNGNLLSLDATADLPILYARSYSDIPANWIPNGTDPESLTSTIYTEPFLVANGETIYAATVAGIGADAGRNFGYRVGAPVQFSVSIAPPPPPEIYPPSGSYTGSQMFGIASAPGTYIRFTTDGTDPTISSEIWSRGLRIRDGLTVKAIAVADGDIISSVASATYSLTGNKIQAIPSYQAAVLPYLLEQYKGDNP